MPAMAHAPAMPPWDSRTMPLLVRTVGAPVELDVAVVGGAKGAAVIEVGGGAKGAAVGLGGGFAEGDPVGERVVVGASLGIFVTLVLFGTGIPVSAGVGLLLRVGAMVGLSSTVGAAAGATVGVGVTGASLGGAIAKGIPVAVEVGLSKTGAMVGVASQVASRELKSASKPHRLMSPIPGQLALASTGSWLLGHVPRMHSHSHPSRLTVQAISPFVMV